MKALLRSIQRKWDWWIYCRSVHSLRRMTLDNPGLSYLMELQMRGWNEQLQISPELKRATEAFHDSMRRHSQNAALCHPAEDAGGAQDNQSKKL